MHNDQIIQKIKSENLKPISKKVFLFRKVSIWFLFAITTVFGAYAFAFFFLKTLSIEFDNWHYLNNSYNWFLVENIPIIWIILFIFSLLLMFYLFKKTNKGYKYSIVYVGAGSVIISFFLGVVLAKTLAYNGLLIDRFENETIINWTNPESGRLSGEVLFVNNDYVLIRDIKDGVWNVNIDYILDNSRQVLQDYQVVSIVGKYDYENNFTACQIIPLNIDKMRFKPNPVNKYNKKMDQNNDFVKDICDFVINNN
jgi:hypothetical protein